MRGDRRRQLARLAAPAAFLLAATIAVLLVRAALRDADQDSPPAVTTTRATTTAPGGPTARARYHVIRRGDTLGSVAERYGTSVDALRALNPEVDPVALTVGQRIRVR